MLMKKTVISSDYFSVKDTLECGQLFRFSPYKKGYLVYSDDKCTYVYNDGEFAIIECDEKDEKYFYDYFDLIRDYSDIYSDAQNFKYEILRTSADLGKGIRILNQNKFETLISFIVSQNNNIPRIKRIVEKICKQLGERKNFDGIEYFTFPTAEKMDEQPLTFYKGIGLGYRAEYVKNAARLITDGYNLDSLSLLETSALKKELLSIKGVGPKVADCVSLFGFHRSDSFPVDTWIEKVYAENFNGKLKNRKAIAEWFVNKFGVYSGYYQQYLFYYKRSLEKTQKKV